MIYSFRHPKRAAKKMRHIWSEEAASLLKKLAELKSKVSQSIMAQKPAAAKPQVLSNTTEGISPQFTHQQKLEAIGRAKRQLKYDNYEVDEFGYPIADQCGYPIKRDLNPKIEAVMQPVTLEAAMSEPNFATRETIATIARRSALNVGIPPRDLTK